MSLFAILSDASRKKKLQLFTEIMNPSPEMSILDVGAEVDPEGLGTRQFIDSYPWKDRITAVNLSPEHVQTIRKYYPGVQAFVADALALPWPDKHFDIAYSNAVIEHVGDFGQQAKMAAEIMRVSKRWFVTTPNRWYPFEFHLRLPFVTWLPWHGYRWVGRLVRYNHIERRYVVGVANDDALLLSVSGLSRCFPGSRIVKQRITFMAETLIAVGGAI
ncbi:MAG: class I SAM-dependent methyltransferase [Phycisphaerae bacterium]|nr:class I SAM-dependent methyltransferase [Phycisphaerae bacterium]